MIIFLRVIYTFFYKRKSFYIDYAILPSYYWESFKHFVKFLDIKHEKIIRLKKQFIQLSLASFIWFVYTYFIKNIRNIYVCLSLFELYKLNEVDNFCFPSYFPSSCYFTSLERSNRARECPISWKKLRSNDMGLRWLWWLQ